MEWDMIVEAAFLSVFYLNIDFFWKLFFVCKSASVAIEIGMAFSEIMQRVWGERKRMMSKNLKLRYPCKLLQLNKYTNLKS